MLEVLFDEVFFELDSSANNFAATDSAPDEPKSEADQKIERIIADVRHVEELLFSDWEAAEKRLEALLAKEDYQNLDDRYDLEGMLVHMTALQEQFHVPMVFRLAHEFSWDIDIRKRPFTIVDRFSEGSYYSEAYRQLSGRLASYLSREHVVAANRKEREPDEALLQAEEALFSPYDIDRLEACRKNRKSRAELKNMLAFMQKTGFDQPGLAELDRHTVDWALEHKFLQPAVSIDDGEEGSSSSGGYWIAFICIFLCLQIFRFIAEVVDSSEAPTPDLNKTDESAAFLLGRQLVEMKRRNIAGPDYLESLKHKDIQFENNIRPAGERRGHALVDAKPGHHYFGELRDMKPHGLGIYRFPEGSMSGYFADGIFIYGKFDDGGLEVFEGYMEMGRPSARGRWERIESRAKELDQDKEKSLTNQIQQSDYL